MKNINFITLSIILLSGCTLSQKSYSSDFGTVVIDSLKDPFTWGNLVLAGVIAPFDHRISRYMVENKPLFNGGASDESDNFRSYTNWSMQLSILSVAEDYNNDLSDVFLIKTERLLRDNLSSGLTVMTNTQIQNIVDRKRPLTGSGGFPSGHTSRTFATAYFARQNYNNSFFNDNTRTSLIFFTYLSAYTTGIARIEAGAHYPSDVLVGAALGNFGASILYHYTNEYIPNLKPIITASKHNASVGFEYVF